MNMQDGNFSFSKETEHKSLEERAEEFDGKLGPYEEFVWGEPKGREVW